MKVIRFRNRDEVYEDGYKYGILLGLIIARLEATFGRKAFIQMLLNQMPKEERERIWQEAEKIFCLYKLCYIKGIACCIILSERNVS